MKALIKNWNKFLVEAELDDTSISEPTAANEVAPPTEGQMKTVKDFLKTIVALADAADDADQEAQETAVEIGDSLEEASAARKARMQRKARRARTKRIKDMAGLVGVKLKDFTPEQKKLYDTAKQELRQMEDAAEFNFLNTLANGNMLDIPVVKKTIDQGGAPLKTAITAVLAAGGASQCIDELTLRCLTQSLSAATQGL